LEKTPDHIKKVLAEKNIQEIEQKITDHIKILETDNAILDELKTKDYTPEITIPEKEPTADNVEKKPEIELIQESNPVAIAENKELEKESTLTEETNILKTKTTDEIVEVKNIIVILNNLLTEKKYGEALIESQKLLQKIAQ
jgi:hypothetical protein